jgi:hypothetical protein
LVKDCRNAATPEPAVAENVANQTDSNAPSSREDEVAGQMDASRALRSRFEVGLQSYLNQQARNVTVDETALEAAFKFLYDRSEHLREFGELTLADYIQLFLQERCWARSKDIIKLKKEEVEHMLHGVRDTRNDLAHFRDDQVTAQRRLQLKVCAAWLGERERLIAMGFGGTTPS